MRTEPQIIEIKAIEPIAKGIWKSVNYESKTIQICAEDEALDNIRKLKPVELATKS